MSQSFVPEVLYCTAGECLEEAAVAGYATFEIGRMPGVAEHERLLTFSLPVCLHHSYVLRSSENRLVELNGGVPQREPL